MDLARETILLLDEIAANAVVATTVQLVDGWLLRASPEAPFRRPNSVLPVRGEAHGLAARFAVVEEFYRRRGLPVRYQLGPFVEPPALDGQLAARGYAIEASTTVQVASVADVRDATAAGVLARDVQVALTDGAALGEPWLAAHRSAHGDERTPARRIESYASLMPRLGPRGAAAAVLSAAGTLAAGFVVVERGWGGIFGMGTRPEARRRGVARTLLQTLAEHACELGATRLYLQVENENAPALALYAAAGFDRAYGYHYRSLDLPAR